MDCLPKQVAVVERWATCGEVAVSGGSSVTTTVDRSATLCSVQGLFLKYAMINAVFSVLTLSNLWHDCFSQPRVHFPSCSSPKLRFSCLVSELHQLLRLFDMNRNAP